ncbi:DUF3515 family protein [Streptomyces monomycini]|uniref:DUF3515 family protein n=1 Tax=Streptomyces monomycini TaxID=371720 RepID=UPI000998113D|nr:DUF3515 family protein [Streptomyces monomycini]
MVPPSKKTLVTAGAVGGTALAAAGVLAFSFLTAPPDIASAPNASHPLCGDLARHYPPQLLGEDRTEAKGAGVAVWGDSTVVLRCGMKSPGPTTDLCLDVNGVDWVLRSTATGGSRKTLITYGRDPAVEVTVAAEAATSAGDTLVDLGDAVKAIPQTSKCV